MVSKLYELSPDIEKYFTSNLDLWVSGPILESTACIWFFRKIAKKGKIFENLDKNLQNLKMFLKRAASCVRLSQAWNGCAEYAMGVVIHETFSFHYLAAFLAFFFWSVNCTSL